ncbi:MAG: NAD-dependent epimerase [Bacteroidota bacterium]
MKILVTGAAGFIGFHITKKLLEKGHEVVGLDNINDYYNINLKYARLENLGVARDRAELFHKKNASSTYKNNFSFVRMNLENREGLPQLFEQEKFDVVCNLAAQAGVRNSIKNPNVYVDSNVVAFLNLLECCRHNAIQHLVYASSSSVYGSNTEIPFKVTDNVDHPISLYAATKRSNELMAHTYSHLYGFPTTGLRFFTVYGPWGRPDMALFLFTDAIVNGKVLKVFNHGEMERDFTYIDDISQGVVLVLEEDIEKRRANGQLPKLYNIGNNTSVKLSDFIKEIETHLNKEAKKEMLPIQPGDVEKTWANVDNLIEDYGYKPNTTIQEGVRKYVEWYSEYYGT